MGSRIRDPGSGIRKKTYSGSVSRVKKAPDLGFRIRNTEKKYTEKDNFTRFAGINEVYHTRNKDSWKFLSQTAIRSIQSKGKNADARENI